MELRGTELHMAGQLQARDVMRHELVMRAARALYDFYLRAGSRVEDSGALDAGLDRALDKLIALRSGPDRALPAGTVAAVDELIETMRHVTDPAMQRMWLSLFPQMVADQLTAAVAPVAVRVRRMEPSVSRAVGTWWGALSGKWQIHSDADMPLTRQVAYYVSWMESGALAHGAREGPGRDDEPTDTSIRRRHYALAA